MNLYHLRYFVQLTRTQHYTKAAEQLNISQPSLSHAIAQLEGELGVPLFEKSGRNTTLTHFGREFLVCAEKTLAALDEGVQAIQRNARGEGVIRLGLLRTLGVEYVPQLAARFLEQNPGKEIRFTFDTGVTEELLDGLAERRFDLAFCSEPPQNRELTAVPVNKQDLVLIVHRSHPLASRHSVELRETLAYPQIYFSKGTGLRSVVDQLFAHIGAQPNIAYETQEDQVIAGLVAQGFGIAVVPYMDLLHRLDVKILQINDPAWERNFYMVHDERAFLSPVVRSFRQFVLEQQDLQILS